MFGRINAGFACRWVWWLHGAVVGLVVFLFPCCVLVLCYCDADCGRLYALRWFLGAAGLLWVLVAAWCCFVALLFGCFCGIVSGVGLDFVVVAVLRLMSAGGFDAW